MEKKVKEKKYTPDDMEAAMEMVRWSDYNSYPDRRRANGSLG